MYLQEPPRGDGASSSVNFLPSKFLPYSSTVMNYLRCPCLAVSPHNHNNPTFCSNCG